VADGRSVVRSGLVVLVVEDNDRIRKAEAETLRGCGYDVLTATSATEALQLLTGSRVDLLITDIRLPGCRNGIALARAVKHSWPDVKVMIVGADVDQFSPVDLRPLADDLLKKPFKLSELEERVAILPNRKPGHD
jgi:DNA-binding response OmpR family regulator